MTHTSIEDTEKLVTLLLAKLTKNDCNVKYKVLMVIKVRALQVDACLVCTNKYCSSFFSMLPA